jgi:gamma-glutamylcyclotransferase (GGCT)/AIG2-like uncharacterized protein YtfP
MERDAISHDLADGPGPAAMNSHLFVYGTLLSRVQHPMGGRLQRQARFVGEATIQGRLYSLGRYPGLVEAADARCVVKGEVYALNDPAAALQWLDAYEGIVAGKHDQNAYERVERPVRLASGGTLVAWVYLYRKCVRTRPEVLGGYWIPPQD